MAVEIASQPPSGATDEKARLARAIRRVDKDEKRDSAPADNLDAGSDPADAATTHVDRAAAITTDDDDEKRRRGAADDLDLASERADAVTTQVERADTLWTDFAGGRLDIAAINNEIDTFLALLQKLDRSGRFAEQFRVARAVSRLLAVGLRWVELLRTLRRLLNSAQRLGHQEAKAWALHELGTLYLAAGELVRADQALSEASALRKQLGDTAGAAATDRNLLVLCRTLRWMVGTGRLVERKGLGRLLHMSNATLLFLVLFAAGAATAAAADGGLLGGGGRGLAIPTVTQVSPSSGPASGHTTVTIRGTGLAKATEVLFGTRPATDVRVVGDPRLVVDTPPGTGTVAVVVVAPDGRSARTPSDRFTYTAGSHGRAGGGGRGRGAGQAGGGQSSNSSKRKTQTTVTCAPKQIQIGMTTTCIAAVSPVIRSDASTPAGSVGFRSSGSGSFSGSGSCVLAQGACSVSYTPSAVGSGPQTITASYVGDSANTASSATTTETITRTGTGTMASTATSVSCSPMSVSVSSATDCKVQVSETSSPSAGKPTGSVRFRSSGAGSFSDSGACLLSDGECSVSYTPTAVGSGSRTITATYSGDARHSPSEQTTAITVTSAPLRSTQTNVDCGAGQLLIAQSTPCTATVTDIASGTPTAPAGGITFPTVAGGSFSSNTCQLTPVSGSSASTACQVTYTPDTSGTQSITAQYGGDSLHSSSQKTVQITTLRPTTTTLRCTGATAVVRVAPGCVALVEDTGPGPPLTPTGSVEFTPAASFPDGNSCTLGPDPGQTSIAGCTVPPRSETAAGAVTATYEGDAAHQGSSSS